MSFRTRGKRGTKLERDWVQIKEEEGKQILVLYGPGATPLPGIYTDWKWNISSVTMRFSNPLNGGNVWIRYRVRSGLMS